MRRLRHGLLLACLAAAAPGCSETCDPDDGNLCTADRCDGAAAVHEQLPAGAACDTGRVCDRAGVCATARCGDGVASLGEGCDDGNLEALDGCDPGCQAEPTAVRVAWSPLGLVRGQSRRVVLDGTFPDGVREVTRFVEWTSDAPDVVSVEAGRVRGLAGGSATVIARVAGLEVSTPVRVHPQRIAFVTSTEGTGELATWANAGGATGLEAGDAVCAARAAAAGLLGTYRAWLSTEEDDAWCRVHWRGGKRAGACGLAAEPVDAGPWIRTDGSPFAEGAGALAAGRVRYPLDRDELGRRHAYAEAITATGPDGILLSDLGTGDCGGWTTTVGAVWAGAVAGGPRSWTAAGIGSCMESRHLLCLEVAEGSGPPLEPWAAAGKLAFVTSARGNGDLSSWAPEGSGPGVAAGDAICASAAARAGRTGEFLAWLGGPGAPPDARFTGDGPWVRPDGVVVAHGRDELVGGLLGAPVAQDEGGEPIETYAWTGASSIYQPRAEDCGGWTSGSADLAGSIGLTFRVSEDWAAGFALACDVPQALYCLEP